jgi:hypothetical protein
MSVLSIYIAQKYCNALFLAKKNKNFWIVVLGIVLFNVYFVQHFTTMIFKLIVFWGIK